jgi:hypothetical protein
MQNNWKEVTYIWIHEAVVQDLCRLGTLDCHMLVTGALSERLIGYTSKCSPVFGYTPHNIRRIPNK